ncbi:MAG: HAD family phosphatase, partial [Rikenellaceae bacterium]|nr:HAD family phosphatase [Rikenellaceae bacterium]
MKKAIIFDMDGVLVDNRDVHMEAFETFAERHGLTVTRDRLLLTFGKTNDQIFDALFGEGRFTTEEKYAMGIEKEIIYREIFEKRIEPAPGLVKLLRGLKSKGVKMAVGSSGPLSNVEFVLERCGISEYFGALAHGGIISK